MVCWHVSAVVVWTNECRNGIYVRTREVYHHSPPLDATVARPSIGTCHARWFTTLFVQFTSSHDILCGASPSRLLGLAIVQGPGFEPGFRDPAQWIRASTVTCDVHSDWTIPECGPDARSQLLANVPALALSVVKYTQNGMCHIRKLSRRKWFDTRPGIQVVLLRGTPIRIDNWRKWLLSGRVSDVTRTSRTIIPPLLFILVLFFFR